jgi:hypothetical protein
VKPGIGVEKIGGSKIYDSRLTNPEGLARDLLTGEVFEATRVSVCLSVYMRLC